MSKLFITYIHTWAWGDFAYVVNSDVIGGALLHKAPPLGPRPTPIYVSNPCERFYRLPFPETGTVMFHNKARCCGYKARPLSTAASAKPPGFFPMPSL